MNSNLFSDIGLIFFVAWSFAIAKLSLTAFGKDLLPNRLRDATERRAGDATYSRRPNQ